MAIINRDLFSSQKREVFQATIAPTITAATYLLCNVPYPATLVNVVQSAVGLSGAPNHSIWLNRFVVGSGITTIIFGNSFVVSAAGTSGVQAFSLALAATFPLLANDMLILSTAAANTNAATVTVSIVIQALEDYKSTFGTP